MKLKIIALLMLLFCASSVYAGKTEDKFAAETLAAARVTYNFAMLSIYEEDCGGNVCYRSTLEPVICWPFPIELWDFYRNIQDRVNDKVNSLPRREQNRVQTIVGWYVWNAVQQEYGCS